VILERENLPAREAGYMISGIIEREKFPVREAGNVFRE
jgi:hypothetical protein